MHSSLFDWFQIPSFLIPLSTQFCFFLYWSFYHSKNVPHLSELYAHIKLLNATRV
jgi:hypothetical protein